MPPNLDPSLRELPAALASEFELEHEIGRGGMGVVFRARDVVLDRPVALKVLPPALGEDADIRARFLREARTAGQLSHPHIVAIFRADERAGFAFFAMALVDGETLGQRVKDRGPLPAADVVRHLREVAWALAYAHARGVIHRDIKPENIMIERGTNRALVTDFGIARTERALGHTSEGQVLGTAHFMSPEQIQGTALDGRSDLYSLGVVGYFLLSGKLPFDGNVASAVLVAHLTQRAPGLRSVAPNVPAPLADIIDRCLAKDPRDRFASGETLEEALAGALEGTAVTPAISGPQSVLSEAQAAAVWRRAAQLQAEAAARLERQSRTTSTRMPGVSSAPDGLQDGGRREGALAIPTASYRAQDVEAAAVEAGISQRFVALALSELPTDATAAELDPTTPTLTNRVGKALLGPLQRSVSVSRVIRAPARETLQAIGRAFQGMPHNLTLREQIGPHPLDGGILVFRLPDMDASGGHPMPYVRYGLGRDLRVTLRPLEHDRGACEVSIYVDARPALGMNVWTYGGLSFGATAFSASFSGVFAAEALALAGAMVAASAGIVALAAGAVAIGASRVTYRWGIRKATRELEDLLLSIETALRSRSIFEGDVAVALPPARAADADPPGDRDW